MEMKSRIRKSLIALTSAALLFTQACASIMPFGKRDELKPYTGINGRFAWPVTFYDLKLNESKDVPVHHSDAGFLHGSTRVNASGSGFGVYALRPGLEAVAGNKSFEFLAGADLDVDLTEVFNGQGVGSMYDYKQQESDKRDKDHGSFVYDKLNPEFFSVAPFIGARLKGETVLLGGELAFLNKEFRREWGHHRFNTESSIDAETYSSNGQRLSVLIGWREDQGKKYASPFFRGFEFSTERYDLEGKGKLNEWSFMGLINFKF